MGEFQVSVDGVRHPLDQLFFVIATQNPIEFNGTYLLPEAQMDRFAMQFSLGYVSPEDEVEILSAQQHHHPIEDIGPCASLQDILAVKDQVKEIWISAELQRYVVEIVRMTRSSVLEVIHEDYVRTAWAKGLSERVVILRHALRNAGIPVLTVISLQFGYLLGGAVLTETIFAWPGIGRWLILAVHSRDFPAIQGGVLLVATTFVTINLIADLLYAWLDPRISYQGGNL